MMPALPQNDEASLLTLGFAIMCVVLIGIIIVISNVWVRPLDAIEEGAFEYEDEVYLVEKAPPGTILKDGAVYMTELFDENSPQTQPSE